MRLEPFSESDAGKVLHDCERDARCCPEVVDRYDLITRNDCQLARLGACSANTGICSLLKPSLHCNGTPKLLVVGLENDAICSTPDDATKVQPRHSQWCSCDQCDAVAYLG